MSDCVDTPVERDDGWDMIHVPISNDSRALWCSLYGLTHFDQLFTWRQLVVLSVLSDLIGELRERVYQDAIDSGLPGDDTSLDGNVCGTFAYAEAVSVYLGININRLADRGSVVSHWDNARQKIRHAFARQALPMVWDFCESNPLEDSRGTWLGQLSYLANCLDFFPNAMPGIALQCDSRIQHISEGQFVSTDPPYYDNVGYADLSDFFYVWLRRSLRSVFPGLFAAVASPKSEELIAAPFRHGGKRQAEAFFRDGMTQTLRNLVSLACPSAPITIYYAYKKSDSKGECLSSPGWEAFWQALINSGFLVTAIWPIRTELTGNLKKTRNAIASSIVFVCRKRPENTEVITRHQFIRLLAEVLPRAIDQLTSLREDVLQ